MAQRRMFALTIIDSDAFLDMPVSAQNLYFHLGMRADDDGFINNVKSIMRQVGCKEDDLKLLIAKKFILLLENGIIVIKHWNINNYIQKDRYTETKYKEQKALLHLDENKAYSLNEQQPLVECIQDGYEVDTQVRLGKVSKDKVIYIKHIPDLHYVKLPQDKYDKLKEDYPNIDLDDWIIKLEDYVASNGNKNKYKDWNRVLRRAIRDGWFNNNRNNYSKSKREAPVPHWYDKYNKDPKCSEDTPREDILREKKAKGTITQEEEKELKELEAELENLTELAKNLFND